MKKQQQETTQQEETTAPDVTTTTINEQQQQTTTNKVKQQQRDVPVEPKLAVKTKGVVITDLKLYLEEKRVERAARGSMSSNKVNKAESHNQPGVQQRLRAHRQRLPGISGRNELEGNKIGAAKGD